MSRRVVRKTLTGRARRRKGIRKNITGTPERPRLSVYRSNRNIYCQIVDDIGEITLVSASTLEKGFREGGKRTKTDEAAALGEVIARKATEKGIKSVVFDRGGYKFHGRVASLAEAARENGLEF